jgi:hypothetical protein
MALNFRKFIKGLRIVPEDSTSSSETGDLEVIAGTGKLQYRNNLQSSGIETSPVVTEAHSAALTNKTIDADLNTLSNIEDGDIKVGANIARSKLASGTVNSIALNDASGVLTDVTLSSAQILLGDASSIPTATTVSGEVTIDSLGVTTVGTVANAVTSGFLRTEMQSLAVSSTITTTKSFVRLNSGSGTINGITAGLNGQHLVLSNLTGASVIVQNQSGSATAVDRVVTGTGGAVSLENGASLFLIYNSTDARWYVVGGSGSGSSTINVVGAGAGVVAGKPVYLDSSGNAQLIDAANDNKIGFIGIALDTSRVQVGGEVTISGASFTVGQTVFINAMTPGSYTQTAPSTAGTWVVPVGTASASDRMVINGAGGSTAVKITSEVDAYVYAAVTAVSSNTTLTNGNSIILATGGAGGITVTLPAPTSGKIFNIKKVDAGAGVITISPPSGTIDGAASKTLTLQYDSLTITSNGTNFFII